MSQTLNDSMDHAQPTPTVLPPLHPRRAKYLALAVLFAVTWYFSQLITSEIDSSENWPTTSATVLSSKVVERNSSDGPWYSPEVKFDYTVDGARYTAVDAPIFGMHLDDESRSDTQKIVDQYPPGHIVTVYYYPRWPRVAVLIRGSGFPLTPGFIWIFFGIYFLPPIGFFVSLGKWLWPTFTLIRKRNPKRVE